MYDGWKRDAKLDEWVKLALILSLYPCHHENPMLSNYTTN
jgi:hypothetical protein